jgi:hypothetical protein
LLWSEIFSHKVILKTLQHDLTIFASELTACAIVADIIVATKASAVPITRVTADSSLFAQIAEKIKT